MELEGAVVSTRAIDGREYPGDGYEGELEEGEFGLVLESLGDDSGI